MKPYSNSSTQLPSSDSSPSTTLPTTSARETWSSQWDYLLSLVGISIGLGNVWRFPYICFTCGGGSFLIPYLLMLFFLGIPMFYLETSLGQFASSGCLRIYNACPAFKGVGFASILVTFLASNYYSVLISYQLLFMFYSLVYNPLPFASCSNSWNTINCTTNVTFMNWFEYISLEHSYKDVVRPAEEFFHKKLLRISPEPSNLGEIVLPILLATFIVWLSVFLFIYKGIKVSGKIIWVTASLPLLLMVAILIRGLTLPGAATGIKYLLIPNFGKLLQLEVWLAAASQVFYSMQVGWGSLIALGSYNSYKNKHVLRNAYLIPLTNCLMSILAAFTVFSVLGFLSLQMNQPITSLVRIGLGLVFLVYPTALALMPTPVVWSLLFFAMLFFLGIDSCFVQIESMIASLCDEFPSIAKNRIKFTFTLCGAIFILSIPLCSRGGIYLLVLYDYYAVSIPIAFVCFFEVIAFLYIYGGGRLFYDFEVMLDRPSSRLMWFTLMYVAPIVLTVILLSGISVLLSPNLSYNDTEFPPSYHVFGSVLALVPVLQMLAYWICTVTKNYKQGLYKALKFVHSPLHFWGPVNATSKSDWLQQISDFPLNNKFLHPQLCLNIKNAKQTGTNRVEVLTMDHV